MFFFKSFFLRQKNKTSWTFVALYKIKYETWPQLARSLWLRAQMHSARRGQTGPGEEMLIIDNVSFSNASQCKKREKKMGFCFVNSGQQELITLLSSFSPLGFSLSLSFLFSFLFFSFFLRLSPDIHFTTHSFDNKYKFKVSQAMEPLMKALSVCA